uniref:ABC transporter domain-containing protein n=1 Tax=Chromera velia CCMP2878 TaxID=1169474 RepID=A0A0G4I7U1_9ALVE|eukprot:Cvel_11755.t2-p1 / transcript=Cvel_11755.t2 / gene=Cvel_11755 / organism=Chromera_velia_CCMP2878 / gene_product=ATP-binding cassette sub-family B member 10,, putative / transcript_product=ATP-binding cassette sub-family B member 10,, putative / location=Cvel_scaffold747:16523-26749(+) / protein_length=771 / sequence_SO=supercontig / SO=protein_coding / is_pseudo=false
MLERWQRQLPQSYPSLYRRLPVSSTNLQAHSFRAFSSTPKGQQGEEKTTGDQTKAPSRQSVLDRLIGRYIDAPAGTGVPEQYASFSELWSILSPEKRRLQAALAALGLSSTVTLSFPFLAGRVVDLFGSQEAGLQFVAEQTMLSGGIVILGAAASFCRLYLLETSIERVAFRLRKELFEKLMREDAGFFDKTLTGEIVNRLSGDITLTSRVLFEASAGIRASLNAVIGTGLLFSLAPSHLFGTLLAPVSAIFILGFVYGRLMRQIANARQEALARSMQHAEERISNIKTVRLLNGERLEMETFEKMIDGVYGLSQKNALATAGRVGIFYAAGGLFLLHLIYLSGVMISGGMASLGSTTSLALYTAITGGAFQGVLTAYGDVQKARGSCHRVMSILRADPSVLSRPFVPPGGTIRQAETGVGAPEGEGMQQDRHPTETASFETQRGAADQMRDAVALLRGPSYPPSLSFEDVWFAYPSRPHDPVLRGMSLEIPAGARVALLGESGSGKSTALLLASALYGPSKGRVKMGPFDLARTDPRWVRAQLGVVSQESQLFSGSIRENILYGQRSREALLRQISALHFGRDGVRSENPRKERDGQERDNGDFENLEGKDSTADADEEELQRVASVAHVLGFVSAFPEGFDAQVGERGGRLSGGQRQRVCIARALVGDPKYLIFDEATSALDAQSEKLVHAALQSAMKGRTCLLITHRLSSLDFADFVAVLDDGGVAQFGPKSEVLSNPCEELEILLSQQRHQDTLQKSRPGKQRGHIT